MDGTVLATIIGSVLGSSVIGQAFGGFFSRKKTDADAASALVQSMLQWQNTLTDRIASLEKLIAEKDKTIDELQERIAHLEMQVFHKINPQ